MINNKKSLVLCFSLFLIAFIPLFSAQEAFSYNYLKGDLGNTQSVNYSNVNVNNSQYLRGLTWAEGFLANQLWTPSGSDIYYNSGNVGIGTTSPTAQLTIGTAVATASTMLDVRGNTASWYAMSLEQDHEDGYGLLIDTDADLVSEPAFNVANAVGSMFYVGSNGNVGIGTTSPLKTLHVAKDLTYSQSQSGQMYVGGADGTKRLMIGYDTTNNFAFLEGINFGTAYSPIILNPFSGNVGIGTGTTTPLAKLHTDGGFSSGKILLSRLSDTGVVAGEELGEIGFYSNDGSITPSTRARIIGVAEGGIGETALTFETAGTGGTTTTERMRIDSSGNVGIGTTSPSSIGTGFTTLDVKGTNGGGYLFGEVDSSTLGQIYASSSGNVYLGSYTNHPVKFNVNNTVKMTIDTDGDVGIGTTNPQAKLEIQDTADTYLYLKSPGDSGNSILKWVDSSGNGDWYIGQTAEDGQLNFYNYVTSANALTFQTDGDVILAGAIGNVGIGTTTPQNKLNVIGDGNFTGNLTVGGSSTTLGNLVVEGNFSAKRPYIMVSSNLSQVATLADTVYTVNFTHLEDEHLMGLEGMQNITFLDSGDYLVSLSAIIVTDTNNKHFNIFPQIHNGTAWNNVPRSNTRLEIENAGTEGIIAVTFMLDIDEGEKFRLMYSSDDAGSMTVWTAGSGTGVNTVPETPSIIMTVAKHSEITD